LVKELEVRLSDEVIPHPRDEYYRKYPLKSFAKAGAGPPNEFPYRGWYCGICGSDFDNEKGLDSHIEYEHQGVNVDG